MKNSIITDNLTKVYDGLVAVDSLNLKIRTGEIFGFLGPNGAGKSTAIRMLTTLLPPTGGTAEVLGYDVIDESGEVRNLTGVVPQEPSLYNDLTGLENLKLIGDLYDMTEERIDERAGEMLKLVNLWDRRDNLVSEFSGGMKQRLSLAASLLHEPEIVFMDEPTAGLDPQTRVSLRNLTKELNEEGMTIVYCTHDMEEAEKICDRVGIINRGVIEAVDSPEGLKERVEGEERVEIVPETITEELMESLNDLKYVKKVKKDEETLKIKLTGEKDLHKLIEEISSFTDITELEKVKPSLEDVFVKLTGEEMNNE